MRISDWSSDVCSSDLRDGGAAGPSQEIGLARPARHAKIEPMGSIGLFDHRHLAALVEVVDRHRAEKFLRRRIDRDDPDSLEKIGIVAVHTARRRGRSEEHTSELQSLMRLSYAFFFLKKKIKQN